MVGTSSLSLRCLDLLGKGLLGKLVLMIFTACLAVEYTGEGSTDFAVRFKLFAAWLVSRCIGCNWRDGDDWRCCRGDDDNGAAAVACWGRVEEADRGTTLARNRCRFFFCCWSSSLCSLAIITAVAAFDTANIFTGTSSLILHSNAATGTGPLGRTSTTYRTIVMGVPWWWSEESSSLYSSTIHEPSNSEKNWLSTHLKSITHCFTVPSSTVAPLPLLAADDDDGDDDDDGNV